jgi:hypothetical protein
MKKRKHPRLLALVKEIVAYKLTHNSDGIQQADRSHDPKSFIFWTASDAFIWCKDAWVRTIVEWPMFNQFRAYWTTEKLTSLWKKRLSQRTKERLIKEAIAALRKENKLIVNKRVSKNYTWKKDLLVPDGTTSTYWEYHWCGNALSALAALG